MSTKENELALRVEALEVTLAYQTTTIEDLNRALTEQWKIIDQLTLEQLAEEGLFLVVDHSNKTMSY